MIPYRELRLAIRAADVPLERVSSDRSTAPPRGEEYRTRLVLASPIGELALGEGPFSRCVSLRPPR